MTDTVITVENLSKRYTLGIARHDTLRDRLTHAMRAPLRRLRGTVEADPTEFWALRDVSFEVKRGEVLGIIGRNGAGKSTLLKILSRITEPTTGRIRIRGRVASLLEVGTGFHPELTGCENIFLNGAILGMSRAEIRRKFDEIVAFAEVERFIDTAVKHYSSGMYVRLAFAVAAHLEPEILIVDEVLAVGDAAFQNKCLGKMREVSRAQGRTVLFVSHNMDAVRRLCKTAIWMAAGHFKMQGPTEGVASAYLLQGVREGGQIVFDPPSHMTNGMPVALHSIQLEDSTGKITHHFSARAPIRIRIEWENYERLRKPRIGFVLLTASGTEVVTVLDASSWRIPWLEPARRVSSCVLPGQLLNEGEYVIDFSGDSPNRHDFSQGRTGAILKFSIEDDMTLPNKYYGEEGFRDARWPGVILPNIPWHQELAAAAGRPP